MISNYLDPVYNNAYNSVVECSTSNADTRVRFPLGVLIVWFFYSKKEPGGGVSTIITGLAQSVEHGPFKPVAAGSSPACGMSW